jgi:hypothetical protein
VSVFGHVAVGAALGAVAPHPAAALALGVVAHVPADLITHRDFGRVAELLMAVAALILYTWLGDFRLAVIMGAVGGALPDVENLFVGKRGKAPPRFFPAHSGFFRHGDSAPTWQVTIQLGVAIVAAAWVVWAPAFW